MKKKGVKERKVKQTFIDLSVGKFVSSLLSSWLTHIEGHTWHLEVLAGCCKSEMLGLLYFFLEWRGGLEGLEGLDSLAGRLQAV